MFCSESCVAYVRVQWFCSFLFVTKPGMWVDSLASSEVPELHFYACIAL
jgi:hypothetical protein